MGGGAVCGMGRMGRAGWGGPMGPRWGSISPLPRLYIPTRVWDNLRKILLFNLPVNFAQGTSIFWWVGAFFQIQFKFVFLAVGGGRQLAGARPWFRRASARAGSPSWCHLPPTPPPTPRAYAIGFTESPLTAIQVLYVNLGECLGAGDTKRVHLLVGLVDAGGGGGG